MVFKAVCTFFSKCWIVSKTQSALMSARQWQQGHGAKPMARNWSVHRGFAQVTGSGLSGSGCSQTAQAAHKGGVVWIGNGGGHLLRLFLCQVLLIPELPHVSQADFKTHLRAELLWASFQWEQHMAPLQCSFSPGSKQENMHIRFQKLYSQRPAGVSMSPDFTDYCHTWDSTLTLSVCGLTSQTSLRGRGHLPFKQNFRHARAGLFSAL